MTEDESKAARRAILGQIAGMFDPKHATIDVDVVVKLSQAYVSLCTGEAARPEETS